MRHKSFSGWMGILTAGALLPCGVLGQVFVLNVGNHVLLPNTPNQALTLAVNNVNSGPHAVSAINVYIDIADGNGGGDPAPKITGFDLSMGPFNGFINLPAAPTPTLPSKSLYTSTAVMNSHLNPPYPNGTVTFPLGLSSFIELTIDTTGFTSGSWPLKTDLGGGVTLEFLNVNFPNPIPTTHINGTISIVPEPSTYAAVSGVALLVFASYRRFRR